MTENERLRYSTEEVLMADQIMYQSFPIRVMTNDKRDKKIM